MHRPADTYVLVRDLDEPKAHALEEDIRSLPGVLSVVVPPEPSRLLEGCLLLVEHDPRLLQSHAILECVTSSGLSGQLIEPAPR